jgi:hypothetical protein
MLMTSDVTSTVEKMHPTLLRFIQDLNDEELLYFRAAVKEQYNNLHVDTSSGRLRAIRALPMPPVPVPSRNREERQIAGIRKLFSEYDKFAGLEDKVFATIVQEELWAWQSIYSRESAMIESIIDRLSRSEGGALHATSAAELSAMLDTLV